MINELIEQIGGRDAVEDMAEGNWPDSGFYENIKLISRALLEVLDAKPVGTVSIVQDLYSIPRRNIATVNMRPDLVLSEMRDGDNLYTVPPAASVPDRNQLRGLVDMVWNEATESETVPSTADADRIIDKVFHGIVQEPASSRYQSAAPAPATGGYGGHQS